MPPTQTRFLMHDARQVLPTTYNLIAMAMAQQTQPIYSVNPGHTHDRRMLPHLRQICSLIISTHQIQQNCYPKSENDLKLILRINHSCCDFKTRKNKKKKRHIRRNKRSRLYILAGQRETKKYFSYHFGHFKGGKSTKTLTAFWRLQNPSKDWNRLLRTSKFAPAFSLYLNSMLVKDSNIIKAVFWLVEIVLIFQWAKKCADAANPLTVLLMHNFESVNVCGACLIRLHGSKSWYLHTLLR